MNVLSLFDGMSCGMLALDRLGIKVDNYYASEIDKYAMQVSTANYPEIIQVGDITKLDLSTLPKIDLVMGGSPCQGFSFAGKQLAFDDPRSALFFEFVKCVDTLKPKYFLLENVRMKKEYLDIISEYMGVEPIFINSSLVSAQSRQRYYWTNIPNVEQPEERGIVLRDILEDQPEQPTLMSDKFVARNGDRNCMIDESKEKASNLSAMEYVKNGRQGDYLACDRYGSPQRVGTHVEQVKVRKHEVDITALQYLLREMKAQSKKTNRQIAEETNLPITKVEHWFRTDNSFAIPSDDVWLKLKEVLGIQTEVFDKPIMDFEYRDGVYESTQRVYGDHGKSPTLTASNSDQLIQTSDKPQKIHDIPKDVLKDNERQRRVYSKEGKSPTLLARADSPKVMKSDKPKHIGTAVDIKGHDQIKRVYSPDGKSPTVTTCGGGHREPKVVMGAWRGRYNEDGSTSQKLELRKDQKTNTITTVQKDNVVVSTFSDKRIEKFKETLKENPQPSKNGIIQLNNPSHSSGRVYSPDGKSPTLMAGNSGGGKEPVKINDDIYWRKLTPLECERLQTVPDNYTNHVSNTQRYKMLGNGWTIEVIAHIFKNMESV